MMVLHGFGQALLGGTLQFSDPNILLGIVAVGVSLGILFAVRGLREGVSRKHLFLFLTRFLILSFIVIAFAGPFARTTRIVEGDPHVTIVRDNSSSMNLLNADVAEDLAKELEKRVPTTVRSVSSGERSTIGDDLLSLLEPNGHYLLVSDGQVTHGTSLDEIAVIARGANATISAVELRGSQSDASVSILGPGTTTPATKNEFLIKVRNVSTRSIPVRVTIDGREVAQRTTDRSFVVRHAFTSKGDHTVAASIQQEDEVDRNNRFVKTIEVVDAPSVLYVGNRDDPLHALLDDLYKVDVAQTVPKNLSAYYAVVLNDRPAPAVEEVDVLRSFVIDGNGLVVVGGFSSFEHGNYANAPFEQLLPVKIGGEAEAEGGANIIFLMDRSGSVQDAIQTEKALAISAIESLPPSASVGAIALGEDTPDDPVAVMSRMRPLAAHRAELTDKIARLTFDGIAFFTKGLRAATQMLEGAGGSKNIILLSDGRLERYSRAVNDEERSIEVARELARRDIRLITIGVGDRTDERFLQRLATASGGIFLRAGEEDRLSVLFGEISQEQGDRFPLTVIDSTHFITQGLRLGSFHSRFNQVEVKPAARHLIASAGGNPSVAAWRFGLGRVATFTTFSNTNTLGDVLNTDPELVSRVVNWNIGHPERKKEAFVDVPDGRIREQSVVEVKSDVAPAARNLSFSKTGEKRYVARFMPTRIGTFDLFGEEYAVNYPREFEDIGQSDALSRAVSDTNGDMFDPANIDAIADHVREQAKQKTVERQSFALFFILLAFLLYTGEVMARRIERYWRP